MAFVGSEGAPELPVVARAWFDRDPALEGDAAVTSTYRPDFRRKPGWVLLFAGFSLVLVAAGYVFSRHDVQQVRLRAYDQLAAIGEMKADQIANWRQERLADTGKTARSPFFVRGVTAWLRARSRRPAR